MSRSSSGLVLNMTFKLKHLVLFVLLINTVVAVDNPFIDLENELIKFDSSTYVYPSFAEVKDYQLHLTLNSKTLLLDLDSITENVFVEIFVEDNSPKISITSNEKTTSIKQIKEEETLVYYGKPSQTVIESNTKLVYIVEHYSPDKEVTDSSRKQGVKRLTAVVKDAVVEIDNGIIVRTDGLKVHTKSFLEAETLEDKEIDFIGNNKLTEIFGYLKSLVVRVVNKFRYGGLFDRGFAVEDDFEAPDLDFGTEFVDVVDGKQEGCNKFGFVFVPGFGYDYLSEVNKLTKNKGYAVGIAYSRNDNFASALEDMTEFIQKAKEDGLTPVIRIMGNVGSISQACREDFGIDACENEGDTMCNGAYIINCNNVMEKCNVWQAVQTTCSGNQEVSNCNNNNYCFGDYAYNEIINSDYVATFIKKLDQKTDFEYVQVWDQVDNYFTVEQYVDYVKEIKNSIEPDIKLISGSVSDEELFNELTDLDNTLDFFTISTNIETDKQVFFETSSQDSSYLKGLLEDQNIKGIFLSVANYWNKYEKNYWTTDDNWIDSSTKELKVFAIGVSDEVCE